MNDANVAALDTVLAVAELWSGAVEHNAIIASDAALSEAAQEVSELIGAFYQQAGRALLDDNAHGWDRQAEGE